MPILSDKRIIMPHATSTLPGLWPVQLKPFAPLPVSLMSPVCYSIPVLLGPLMLESRKLRYLFCQVELFSCRHWQRELFYSLALWRLRDALLQSREKSAASVFHCQKRGVQPNAFGIFSCSQANPHTTSRTVVGVVANHLRSSSFQFPALRQTLCEHASNKKQFS